MRIVMDFDGVFTDPTDEGDACLKNFRDQILDLNLTELDLASLDQVDSWFGELRARQASQAFDYGWRSEGRVSAFTFEDPFIRNIGLADFLDAQVAKKDKKASKVLAELNRKHQIKTYGELSENSFHKLSLKKRADPVAKKWVMDSIDKGHEVTIVSNSATDKIEAFLNQNDFPLEKRPKVRGGARKFGLGPKPQWISLSDSKELSVRVDTARPWYEEALLEVKPDAVIGDVFSLDLSLPLRLKREKKLNFDLGIFYFHRDYTPSTMVELISGRGSLVKEVTLVREWSQIKV